MFDKLRIKMICHFPCYSWHVCLLDAVSYSYLFFLYVRSNRKFNEWGAMAAAAIAKALEGILLVVVVGNGGLPYRALQN